MAKKEELDVGYIQTLRKQFYETWRQSDLHCELVLENNSWSPRLVAVYSMGFVMKLYENVLKPGEKSVPIPIMKHYFYEILIYRDKDNLEDLKKKERFQAGEKVVVKKLRQILAYGETYEEEDSGFLQKVSWAADHVPLVGHLKSGVHYLLGDSEKASKAAINSSLSTVCVITGGFGGMMLAGGKIVAESLIPVTQSQEQKEKVWTENVKDSISRAPLIGYGVAGVCALVGESEQAAKAFAGTTGSMVGCISGQVTGPFLSSIPGIEQVAERVVSKEIRDLSKRAINSRLTTYLERNSIETLDNEMPI